MALGPRSLRSVTVRGKDEVQSRVEALHEPAGSQRLQTPRVWRKNTPEARRAWVHRRLPSIGGWAYLAQ